MRQSLLTLDDYRNWDALAYHCRSINELTEIEKEKAERAFQFLKVEFGEDFLIEAYDYDHPIISWVNNLAPWTRKWFIRFSESLKDLKSLDNYPNLLKRLKDRKGFNEALSVLEVTEKLSKAGFMTALDPIVNIQTGYKKPDLKIWKKDSEEILYAEVSQQFESEQEVEAKETMDEIFGVIWRHPSLLWSGRIYKSLSERHIEEIVNNLKITVEKSKEENKFRELTEEGVAEIAVAPDNDKAIIEKWAVEKKLRVGEFIGPPFNVDKILRLKNKIRKEQRQLPKDEANLMIIKNNNFFIRTNDIRQATYNLEEEVYKYPHILAIVISGGHLGPSQIDYKIIGQNIYIQKTKDFITEKHLILIMSSPI